MQRFTLNTIKIAHNFKYLATQPSFRFNRKTETNENSNPDKVKDYVEICQKEKKKIKNFEAQGSKQYFSTLSRRFTFWSFFLVINLYILQEIAKILWNFYFPYKNHNEKIEFIKN